MASTQESIGVWTIISQIFQEGGDLEALEGEWCGIRLTAIAENHLLCRNSARAWGHLKLVQIDEIEDIAIILQKKLVYVNL